MVTAYPCCESYDDQVMNSSESPVPNRAETIKVLSLMGNYAPILMLRGDGDGYGARWSVQGHPVEPAIARYLMELKYVVDTGATEMGARRLALTEAGVQFRKDGLRWWSELNLWQKLKIRIVG